MRKVLSFGVVLALGALGSGTAASSVTGTPHHQTAIVNFDRPTSVATRVLIGTYVVEHDANRMARGEPCTTFYRVGNAKHPVEEAVSFHCIPLTRSVADSFTVTIDANPVGITDTLMEYQFAGDRESHGVPLTARVSTSAPATCVSRM